MIHKNTLPKSTLSQKTLQQIVAEFPTYDWSEFELNELVFPKFGVITGFAEILSDIQRLAQQDLCDIEPAGIIDLDSARENDDV